MNSFDMLPQNCKHILDSIPSLIEKTFPIPGKYRGKLPKDIAELSHLLTNKRSDRSLSYLTRPNFLSAYLYYFLPWNLYRLCLLLPSLDISLSAGDKITDFGCGPLTFAAALWIAREDLRKIPLEINCIDRSGPALEAGKKFFNVLANPACPWKINIKKEDIDIRKTRKGSSNLVCAVNIYNEVYEHLPHNNTKGLLQMAANAAKLMHNEASEDASIFIMEPGVPRSGHFISFLRNSFLELNRPPVSPCTHSKACPFNSGSANIVRGRDWLDTKKRWCHFASETTGAPKELRRLSAAAKLPKERLVYSYLLAGKVQKNTGEKHTENVRIISDAFSLPNNRYGRYGCSDKGLILMTGEKEKIEKQVSGSLASAKYFTDSQRDVKSGALLSEV